MRTYNYSQGDSFDSLTLIYTIQTELDVNIPNLAIETLFKNLILHPTRKTNQNVDISCIINIEQLELRLYMNIQ